MAGPRRSTLPLPEADSCRELLAVMATAAEGEALASPEGFAEGAAVEAEAAEASEETECATTATSPDILLVTAHSRVETLEEEVSGPAITAASPDTLLATVQTSRHWLNSPTHGSSMLFCFA